MGWHGIDLDGTLARYTGDVLTIGEPIAPMLALVKGLLDAGETVKIFTARVTLMAGAIALESGLEASQEFVDGQRALIEAWCMEHIGQVLEITNVKDFMLSTLYDDRAIQVRFNEGTLVTDNAPAVAAAASLFTVPLYPDEWVYVPGEYVCSVCNCHISKRVILASSGRVGVSPIPENEMCPNGCKVMSRVTWKDRAANLSKYIDTLHELTDKPHLILPPSTNQA